MDVRIARYVSMNKDTGEREKEGERRQSRKERSGIWAAQRVSRGILCHRWVFPFPPTPFDLPCCNLKNKPTEHGEQALSRAL